ncbi:kirola-like [Cucumis melo var. makuwa]|uniref:Kirola-like n=1 Tax=Cucumis melo var. makuwa TaxID=1194695 RepID=A0A5A7UL28_CUCMM|nr:kirola-like [Cucumis melo var. makuwa]
MVLERDIEQTLEDTTNDGNQTKETTASFSAAVDTWISAAMDEKTPHAPSSELHAPIHPLQIVPTIPSAQPLSSSVAYIAPHVPIYVLPPNSGRPPPLLP